MTVSLRRGSELFGAETKQSFLSHVVFCSPSRLTCPDQWLPKHWFILPYTVSGKQSSSLLMYAVWVSQAYLCFLSLVKKF